MLDRLLAFLSSAWKLGPLRAGAEGAPDGDDRRNRPRHPHSLEVRCRPTAAVGDPPGWPAVVQDISKGGLGLRLSRPVDIDSLLSLTWSRPVPGLPPSLTVRVLRVTPEAGGLWHLGCAFAADLNEPQLQALLDALEVGDAPNKLR